jgi:LacI family transcriptional regulator
MNKKVSMADVAKKVGLSRATVSYVLNETNSSSIPEETKAKIWLVANELGYRPNALAKNLRGGKSNVLGLITDNIQEMPFIVDIIRGAQETALLKNKMLLVMDTQNCVETEIKIFTRMAEWQVEGVIYTTTIPRKIKTTPYFFYTPTILVDCFDEQMTLPVIIPNEIQGGYVATKVLLEKGHRRIGFINGPRDLPASIGRLEGYCQALAEFQVAYDEKLIRNGDWWQESGYAFTLELIQQPNPPSAIFCGNDWIAMGSYDALKKLGKVIPKDVAIIGFDNREVIAKHMHPSLTTVALPYYEMGKRAMEFLIAQNDIEQPTSEYIDCPLVMRDSI